MLHGCQSQCLRPEKVHRSSVLANTSGLVDRRTRIAAATDRPRPATAFRPPLGGTAAARSRRILRPSTAGLRLGMESRRPYGGESIRLRVGRDAPPVQLYRQTV